MVTKNLKEIIDGLICDKTAPALVRKALYMDLKRYCELKCDEQKDICKEKVKTLIKVERGFVHKSDLDEMEFPKPTIE